MTKEKGGSFELARAGPTEQRAYVWGRWVIDNARNAGFTDSQIEAMQARMRQWLKVVKTYEKEIREVKGHASVPWSERFSLITEMRANRERVRLKIFGG